MPQPTKIINGERVPVTRLEGRVVSIDGPHLSVRIETVDGEPATVDYHESVSWPGTDFERVSPLFYGTTAIDRQGRPIPAKIGDPVLFILNTEETIFLEIRVNGVITESSRWK